MDVGSGTGGSGRARGAPGNHAESGDAAVRCGGAPRGSEHAGDEPLHSDGLLVQRGLGTAGWANCNVLHPEPVERLRVIQAEVKALPHFNQ